MKTIGIFALAVLLMLGVSSAAGIIQISDQDAQAQKLYVRSGSRVIYVGGPVKGYTISGYVPYVPTGPRPEYKTITLAEFFRLRP